MSKRIQSPNLLKLMKKHELSQQFSFLICFLLRAFLFCLESYQKS